MFAWKDSGITFGLLSFSHPILRPTNEGMTFDLLAILLAAMPPSALFGNTPTATASYF